MVVKPPRQPLVRAVFEIYDRVLVAVKLFAVKRIARTVHRRCIENICIAADLCSIKFGENGSR